MGIAVATLLGGPAAAATERPSPVDVLVPEFGAYFGASLDWSIDSAAQQSTRLGDSAAVLEHTASLPITDAEMAYLVPFLRQTEREGAFAAITLRPSGELLDFDRDAAQDAVDALARVRQDESLPLYLRFAPDMNSNWVVWGQDPLAYVAAFRLFSNAVHDGLPAAVVVWSPVAGGAYPFEAARSGADPSLDTDGDGLLGSGDDPYGPYYPGDEYVDWVGLSAYHDPSGGGRPLNEIPAPGALESMLDGGGGDRDFYERFSKATGTPMMLETAAFFSPGAGGSNELTIKQEWWRQVIAAASEQEHPLLSVVLWRDSSSARAVVGEVVIDWSISRSAEVASAFRADAAGSELVFGPVYSPSASPGPVQTGRGTISGAAAWGVVAAALLAAVALAVRGLSRGRSTRLAYSGSPSRDLRIDFLRGGAIVFVVINHLGLVSVFQNATQEAIGIVSGAELFVLLSGAVLGLVQRPRVIGGGIGEVIRRTGARAWKLYLTALVIIVVVGVVSRVPLVNAVTATTYVDQGTGAAGSEATGRVYDLFAGFGDLFRYPVNPSVIVDIALLRIGPWQVNVLGLYVVMLIVAPVILWALSRRHWILVLAVSWGVYTLQMLLSLRLLPSQFEDSFPLLTWQALFVTGMVAGFHRRRILDWFATRAGRILLALSIVATVALALFSWNNPYLSSAFDVRLGLVPNNTFSSIYSIAFERTTLEPGRVLNVLLVTVTGYAALSVFWKPVNRILGWFLIPLGQATLYVFIMHVLFVLIVANVPVLTTGSVVINSVAYVVVLALLWVMVKARFLFGVVPR
ncbi:MAG: OpgC domain-containing protein [Burkholderiaceae bacterium]|nr:OpgC domain-containing protein [Microbacteriaceae bacterium]